MQKLDYILNLRDMADKAERMYREALGKLRRAERDIADCGGIPWYNEEFWEDPQETEHLDG